MEQFLKVNVKNMQTESESVKIGDFVVLEEDGKVFQFLGYHYDELCLKDIETNEEIQVDWY